MNLSFENQVALVTGGDYGIGWATAKAFAEAGAAVVLSARREEKLRARVEVLGGMRTGHRGIGSGLQSCKINMSDKRSGR